MNENKLIKKYAGAEVDLDAMLADPQRCHLGDTIMQTAYNLRHTEQELARAAARLAEIADKIRRNMAAGPNDQVPTLNPIGELQHDRTDTLLVQRDQQITHLRTLVRLATA